jgi:hypothetical protein
MSRHQKLEIGEIPKWVEETDNFCLRSVAEDAYTAKAWADLYNASKKKSCRGVYTAAMKALEKMGDENVSAKDRCSAGNRAARKFWEAKVCARDKD